MKNRDGLENNDNWQTPDKLYKLLDDIFHFDFDPYPSYWDGKFDGHTDEWGKSNFINPPYNRIDKPKAIKRAFNEWVNGKKSVLLIPANTDTNQFHDLIWPNSQRYSFEEFIELVNSRRKLGYTYLPFSAKYVVFFKGRIAFKGYNTKGVWSEKNKGKHGSMLVVLN